MPTRKRISRKALERDTANYTSPKDGEPIYYLGLALKAQGKLDEAHAELYKSTWSAAWRSPGYFALAEIDSTQGNLDAALTDDEHALESNTLNIRALALKAALLRHAGRADDALAAIASVRKVDPLDVQGMTEQWLAKQSPESEATLMKAVTEFPATALEVAADYMNAGLWQDGTTLLTHIISAAPDRSKVSPLIYYYLAYFAGRMHQDAKAREYDQLAAKASPDYVFPFQMEMIAVLDDAMRVNSADSRAPYYLGDLLFDWQPQQAQTLWEKSASLGADFPVVYRNLAMVYTRQGNQRDKVQATLEKAVQFGGNAMVFNDLDKLYEENGVSPAKRLALMESHQAVIDRDDVIAREINLEVLAGKPDAAIKLLESRFFRAWEGGGSFSSGGLLDQCQPRAWASAHGRKAVLPGAGRLPGGAADSRQPRRSYWQCHRPQSRDLVLDRYRISGDGRHRESPPVLDRCGEHIYQRRPRQGRIALQRPLQQRNHGRLGRWRARGAGRTLLSGTRPG